MQMAQTEAGESPDSKQTPAPPGPQGAAGRVVVGGGTAPLWGGRPVGAGPGGRAGV